jgi:hypothetical protein
LALFPYSLWPFLWRRLARLRRGDPGVRFALATSVAALATLSLISSKQPHYLLPLLPVAALLAARAIQPLEELESTSAPTAPFAALGMLGLGLGVVHWLAHQGRGLPHWLTETAPGAAVVLIAVAAGGIALRRRCRCSLPLVSSLSLLVFAALHLGVVAVAGPAYDVRPVARYLAFLEGEGVEVAHLGPYHGQFHFAGRLARPFAVIAPREAAAWLEDHPVGRVVGYYEEAPPAGLGEPEFAQPFRGKTVGVWASPGRQPPAPSASAP